MMNRKGFISISVIYTLFMVFLMLLLSVLAAYANNRILLRLSKEDVSDILIESQDSHDLAFTCQDENLVDCFKEKYYLDPNLYLHDGEADVKADYGVTKNYELEDKDDNLRYSGADPHNYICFGVDKCSDRENKENLYRIIGIFNNKIKIIKNTPLNSAMAWSNDGKSNLSDEDNSLRNYLLNDFLNTFDKKWKDKISKNIWNVGKLDYSAVVNTNNIPKNAYDNEKNDGQEMAFTAKVGLMYLSDYYYAADPIYWQYYGNKGSTTNEDYRTAKNDNWLSKDIKENEWTISAVKDRESSFVITKNGNTGSITKTELHKFRPVMLLYKKIDLIGGRGTSDDPYIIK